MRSRTFTGNPFDLQRWIDYIYASCGVLRRKKLVKSSDNKKTSIEMRNLKIAKLCGNSNNHQLFFQLSIQLKNFP